MPIDIIHLYFYFQKYKKIFLNLLSGSIECELRKNKLETCTYPQSFFYKIRKEFIK